MKLEVCKLNMAMISPLLIEISSSSNHYIKTNSQYFNHIMFVLF